MIRTSEFWVAVATGVGQLLTGIGFIDPETWHDIMLPAIVYIISRLLSKFVKKVL
jgi:hypothetical protein